MSGRGIGRALAWLFLATLGCGARTGLGEAEARDAGRAPIDAPRDAPALDARDAPEVPHDAPPDVPVLDAGDPCEIGAEPLTGMLCTRPLFGAEPTLSCPGGFVDVAARGEGTLVWECGGFRAEARFGDRAYRGTRIGERVALCIRTEFDYADGCRWESSQRLEGELGGETLTLTYRERAIAGMGCFPPCTADALVELR